MHFPKSKQNKYLNIICDDIRVRFDADNSWTMGDVAYRNCRLGVDGKTASYGSVIKIASVGFVGAAHKEVQEERIIELSASCNGKKIDLSSTSSNLKVKNFDFNRIGKVKGFTIDSRVLIKNNRIYETTTISSSKHTRVSTIYNFMHPWTLSAKEFIACQSNGEKICGKFTDSNDYVMKKECDWVAIYIPKYKVVIISKILQTPTNVNARILLWDIPGRYRKFYLQSFQNKTIPADFTGTFKLVTGFVNAESKNWKDVAEKVAENLN